ncbi:MAG: holo-ACP synthase [Actinomycetota bacterium]
MIDGIGIDVVDVARFQESLDRTPGMKERLFTSREAVLKISSLAARFAAKEALVKALDARDIFSWHDAEIINEVSGKPAFIFTGALAERIDGADVHLSLSHDAGIASAMVVIERN